MRVYYFRVLALLLLLFRTCAAADMSHLYEWTTNTTNTTTSTSTTSTSTTTTTNTSTTTNTTSTSTSSTSTTTTTNNMTLNMTWNTSTVELTTTTTTTTTRTTTTTNTSTTTNFSTTSTTLEMMTTTPANVSNVTNASMVTVFVDEFNISMNMSDNLTLIPLTYNTTGTTTTTTSGPTTSTSTVTTTCTNCTVTTTMYIWTTVTSTTTSTLAKLCEVPWDPAGNYTLLPWSYRDNSSWDLKCNDTHFPTRGLDHAKCLGNGVLRPAGVCKMSGCSGYDAQWPQGTTCPMSMSEGDTCTVLCGATNIKEEVFGYWTCIRAQLWGAPTCINKEAKYWWVAWILPKIVGAFDFEGQLTRYVNMTNETLATFKTNVTQAMADCLIGVDPSYFVMFDVIHLWQSKDQYDSETGNLLTYERRHLFSVTYELLIWDVNVFWANWEAVRAILVPDSMPYRQFEGFLYWRANMTLIELYPTNYPISYNLSYIAPDTELSVAAPCLMDTRRLLLLVALPSSLMYLLRLMLFVEGQS